MSTSDLFGATRVESRAALRAYTHDKYAACACLLLHGDLKLDGKTYCSGCYLRVRAAEVSPGHVGDTPRAVATPTPAADYTAVLTDTRAALARVLATIDGGWRRSDGIVCVIPNAEVAALRKALDGLSSGCQ